MEMEEKSPQYSKLTLLLREEVRASEQERKKVLSFVERELCPWHVLEWLVETQQKHIVAEQKLLRL